MFKNNPGNNSHDSASNGIMPTGNNQINNKTKTTRMIVGH